MVSSTNSAADPGEDTYLTTYGADGPTTSNGTYDEPTYDELCRFVDTVSTRGGVHSFTIHARKAVLGGLSPAQNRQVPPLRYPLVHRLAADFPQLHFALNGGVDSIEQAAAQLDGARLSGVMSGRAVVARPWDFATLDTRLYGAATDPATSRREVLHAYAEYADACEARIPQKVRHLLLGSAVNLFAGEPHGKQFRRAVDKHSHAQRPAAAALLAAAEETLMADTLDAPPGFVWDHHSRVYRPAAEVEAERVAARAAAAEERAAAAVAA